MTLGGSFDSPADVAQLVAHHLAKVRVASSSLVIRSTQAALLARRLFACGNLKASVVIEIADFFASVRNYGDMVPDY